MRRCLGDFNGQGIIVYLDDVAEQFLTNFPSPPDVFVIDRDSGVVRVTGRLSVERQAHYILPLVLTDGVYNSTVSRTRSWQVQSHRLRKINFCIPICTQYTLKNSSPLFRYILTLHAPFGFVFLHISCTVFL